MSSRTTSWYSNVNPRVFLTTVIIIGLFLLMVVLAPNSFELMTQQLNQWVTTSFSWFYVLSVAIFLILLIFIALSDMGRIKLGPDHSMPVQRSSFAVKPVTMPMHSDQRQQRKLHCSSNQDSAQQPRSILLIIRHLYIQTNFLWR